jgi:translation initiation factor IF-3
VAPNVTPPVCKIGDYGRFRYEIEKREKEARKAHKTGTIKEVKLSPKIGIHDLNVRIDRSNEFLKKGHRVKVTMVFRGREITHKKIGEMVIDKLLEGIKDAGAPEGRRKFMGKNLILIVSPLKGKETNAQSKK